MDYVSKFLDTREKIKAQFPWGQLWQTMYSLHLDVNLEPGTRAKQIQLTVKTRFICLVIAGKEIFKGELACPVIADETLWTVEETILSIDLVNVQPSSFKNGYWKSLLADGSFAIDGYLLYKMRLDLAIEKMQREQPSHDFSATEKIDIQHDDDPLDGAYTMMYKQEKNKKFQ